MNRSASSLVSLACFGLLTAAAATGCSHGKHPDISASAQLVAQGTNKITYTAPRDGMVWVHNKFNNNMEWAGGVRAGDVVMVDPDADKIFVNGRNVNDKPLTNDDKAIYFEPDTTVVTERTSPGMVERRQVVDPQGRVIQQSTTVQPGGTVREYREVRP